jgi:hypothetical protein
MKNKKIVIVFVLFVSIIVLFVKCVQQSADNDPRGAEYAGATTCVQCHQDIVNSYAHTGHFKTSAPFFFDSLKSLLNNTNTTFSFSDSDVVKLEEFEKNILQSHYVGNNKLKSEKMDMVFGSGEKAMTFGYWKDSQLFQLPLTYLMNLHLWTNSPGFPTEYADYTRAIISRCFGCHSSYVYYNNEKTKPLEVTQKFDSSTIIYGIDCERCHGPAKKHVDFHLENPSEKKPMYITNISSLSRAQQSDLCGSCHSPGTRIPLKSIFTFVPGDSLKNYFAYYPGSSVIPDPHGMQSLLLQQSECYKNSTTLTCLTCHNSHNNEGSMQTAIASCISCHNTSTHDKQMIQENQNCINCHMPLRTSLSLDFNNGKNDHNIPYKLRSHKIAVYLKNEME